MQMTLHIHHFNLLVKLQKKKAHHKRRKSSFCATTSCNNDDDDLSAQATKNTSCTKLECNLINICLHFPSYNNNLKKYLFPLLFLNIN